MRLPWRAHNAFFEAKRYNKEMRKYLLPVLVIVAIAGYFGVVRSGGWSVWTNSKRPTAQQFARVFPDDSRKVLEKAPQLTLMSLDPGMMGETVQGNGTFHGYRILGQTQLSGEGKSKLLRSLYDGMAGDGFMASCFSPRHGIRATHNGRTVDLVICFLCMTIVTHFGSKQGNGVVAKATQKYFDSVLKESGIKLSPR